MNILATEVGLLNQRSFPTEFFSFKPFYNKKKWTFLCDQNSNLSVKIFLKYLQIRLIFQISLSPRKEYFVSHRGIYYLHLALFWKRSIISKVNGFGLFFLQNVKYSPPRPCAKHQTCKKPFGLRLHYY